MICIAYLHGSSLARCKSANLIPEGTTAKVDNRCSSWHYYIGSPFFLVLCLSGFPSAHRPQGEGGGTPAIYIQSFFEW